MLKVGIARNLLKRIRDHGRSSQRRLIGKTPERWRHPSQVKSSQSILAKHLYFDRSVSPRHDLTTELGRVRFLTTECRFRYRVTTTRAAARALEGELERSGAYRYVGDVIHR